MTNVCVCVSVSERERQRVSEAEEKQQDSVQSDRQRAEGGQAECSVGQFLSLSLPLNLWIPLLPGHVFRPAQEVEEHDASA